MIYAKCILLKLNEKSKFKTSKRKMRDIAIKFWKQCTCSGSHLKIFNNYNLPHPWSPVVQSSCLSVSSFLFWIPHMTWVRCCKFIFDSISSHVTHQYPAASSICLSVRNTVTSTSLNTDVASVTPAVTVCFPTYFALGHLSHVSTLGDLLQCSFLPRRCIFRSPGWTGLCT